MGKHLSQSDRIKMETMLNSGHKVIEIAEYLHVHRSTIYREMKRGEYTHRNSDYTEERAGTLKLEMIYRLRNT